MTDFAAILFLFPLFSSGNCFYCDRGHTSRCEKSKLLGSVVCDGAQAEYVLCPLGETTLMHAPETVPQEALILMADIFPTGYFVSKNAWLMFNEVERKDATAVVIGCGPVGLCAVTAATHFFKNVYAIDAVPDRLAEAKKHGATETFNFKDTSVDIPAKIKELTGGRGADAVLEVVGAQSAMDTAIKIVRPWGVISSCGIHTHELKMSGLDLYSECIMLDVLTYFVADVLSIARVPDKNIRFQFGRCDSRAIFEESLQLLEKHADKFKGFVQHVVPVEEAAKWYELFEVRRAHVSIYAGAQAHLCFFIPTAKQGSQDRIQIPVIHTLFADTFKLQNRAAVCFFCIDDKYERDLYKEKTLYEADDACDTEPCPLL